MHTKTRILTVVSALAAALFGSGATAGAIIDPEIAIAKAGAEKSFKLKTGYLYSTIERAGQGRMINVSLDFVTLPQPPTAKRDCSALFDIVKLGVPGDMVALLDDYRGEGSIVACKVKYMANGMATDQFLYGKRARGNSYLYIISPKNARPMEPRDLPDNLAQ